MNASFSAPLKTRIAAFAAALLTSTTVLGATVLGMQWQAPAAGLEVVAMEQVVITPAAVH
jgi:hypothetical protein